MRTRCLAAIAALVLFGVSAMPSAAVTDGWPDNGAHPYVGLAVFYDAEGTATHRCSGTMISATVFLTAGHCTSGAASAQVWFDDYVSTASGYPYKGGFKGTPYTHWNFVWSLPNTSDLGVIVLRQRPDVGWASIAALGTLDSLATERGKQDVTFTVVGYGLQEVRPETLAERQRLQATVQIVNLTSALTDGYNIHHTNAPGTGGGTCFGDSGGPVFQGTSSTIVGVTSFGLNENCAGSGFAYRTDIANAHDFIYSYI